MRLTGPALAWPPCSEQASPAGMSQAAPPTLFWLVRVVALEVGDYVEVAG
jgi:hypothetical protein